MVKKLITGIFFIYPSNNQLSEILFFYLFCPVISCFVSENHKIYSFVRYFLILYFTNLFTI